MRINVFAGLILALSTGLSAAMAADEPELLLGNGKNKTVFSYQVSNTAMVGAALYYPERLMKVYEGCEISAVSIDLGGATDTDSMRVFITSSLTGTPDYEQRCTSTKAGWATITLDTPYLIKGQALYIGYELKGVRFLRYSNVLHAGEEWVNKSGTGWQIFTQPYSASLYATVKGEALPRQQVALQHVRMPAYVKKGQPLNYIGQVVNLGLDDVETLTVALDVNGKEQQRTEVTIGPLPNRTQGTFEVNSFTMPEEGSYEVQLRIAEVNGKDDVYKDDNISRTASLLCKEQFLQRNVLMEVFSTEQCPNCPSGHQTIASALDGKPHLIEVEHHAGFYTDKFTIPESVEYEWFYQPYNIHAPAVMFDRTNHIDNYPDYFADSVAITSVKSTLLTDIYQEELNTPAYVSLEMKVDMDAATRQLSIDISGEKVLPIADEDSVRINVWLTEDSLYTEEQRGVSGGYYHRHSLRRCLTSTWGDKIDVSQPFSLHLTTELPANWREERMNAVAFVACRDAEDKNNCRVLNACQERVAMMPLAISDVQKEDAHPGTTRLCRLSGVLTLTADAATLRVYDTAGRLLYQLEAAHRQVVLPEGVYLLQMR